MFATGENESLFKVKFKPLQHLPSNFELILMAFTLEIQSRFIYGL